MRGVVASVLTLSRDTRQENRWTNATTVQITMHLCAIRPAVRNSPAVKTVQPPPIRHTVEHFCDVRELQSVNRPKYMAIMKTCTVFYTIISCAHDSSIDSWHYDIRVHYTSIRKDRKYICCHYVAFSIPFKYMALHNSLY